MNVRSIEFMLEEAFTGIRRNGLMAFASVSTIALSLGVLGAFLLVAMGANNFSASQINKFEIAVFVDAGNSARVEQIENKIKQMDGVAAVTLRDRDKEWAEFKRQRPDIDTAGLPLNVLPYAMDVRMTDASKLTPVAAKIRLMDGVDTVREGRELLGRVMAVAKVVKLLSVIGVLVLLVTTAFIISNAIRLTLYARRKEIRIMQLVGATNETIRLPLVIEGIVFGAAGAVAAWMLISLGATYLGSVVHGITPLLTQFSSNMESGRLALLLLVLGAIIGAAGSFVSIRRFLHD